MTADQYIGTTLAGYRIEQVVGRGGMGVVYRAEHLSLGRKIALKVLAPDLAVNESFRRRFVQESRMAASIEHPNIIPIYEAGEADDLLFLAMRYVEGPDLGRLLAGGALDPRRAVTLLGQVAGALDAAHARGLVHRDVKPGNVLVAPPVNAGAAEHCYLCDFGLIKPFDSQAALTSSGQFFGTVPYMAPEQIKGEALDGRSDVYAFGCVAYRCLTGALPFKGDSDMATVEAHLHGPPPRVTDLRPDLPPAVDPVIARALAKAMDDRHETCGEMVAELRAALAGYQPLADPGTRRFTDPLTGAAPPERRPEATVLEPAPTVLEPAPTVIREQPGQPGTAHEPPPNLPPTMPAPMPAPMPGEQVAGYQAPHVSGPRPPQPPLGFGPPPAPGQGPPPGGFGPPRSPFAPPPARRVVRGKGWFGGLPRGLLLEAVAIVAAVAVLTAVGVGLARRQGGGRPHAATATTVASGVDTAEPGSTDGGRAASCAGGWSVPQPRQADRTRPLDAMRARLGQRGLFVVVEMRRFAAPDGTVRWYVKTNQLGGRPFKARWLVAQVPGAAPAVLAVAPFATKGLASPDWHAFEGDSAPAQVPGLPGAWRGKAVDFVAGGGLPGNVRGCLAGT